jgi:antitoxin component of RelBE/YafQ-DinJ toxin-antitoxin module
LSDIKVERRKEGKGKVKKELIPQFETEEQEAEYWNSHSPLDLVAEPRAQKVRVRGVKDKPITVRLDSESRSKLDRLAAEQGLGPSSFARLILMSVIEQGGKLPKHITLDELKNMLEEITPRLIKDRAGLLVKEAAIGDPNNPVFLIFNRSQIDEWGELGLQAICALLAMYDVQVIGQEHAKYKEVKTLVQSCK